MLSVPEPGTYPFDAPKLGLSIILVAPVLVISAVLTAETSDAGLQYKELVSGRGVIPALAAAEVASAA